MVTSLLIGQLGLPDGIPGTDDGKAIIFNGDNPQDYVLSSIAVGSVTAAAITDASTIGRTVLKAADAAAIRTAIGATGTVTASAITDATTVGRNVVTAADAAAARTAIGAGTSSLAIGTTGSTAKAGDYQPTAANISDSTTVGRAVITAADAAAVRTAAGAQAALPAGSSSQYLRGDLTMQTLDKAAVGLSVVDNTTDLNKPISTAVQTALNGKVSAASPTFTGTVTGVTKTHVGLGNVDNTADVDKPISTATQTALDGKVSTTAEIAEADIVDPTDTTPGLVSGRRMVAGVDAATGGLQVVVWDTVTDSWPPYRLDAAMRIFNSTNDVAATAPFGVQLGDIWYQHEDA